MTEDAPGLGFSINHHHHYHHPHLPRHDTKQQQHNHRHQNKEKKNTIKPIESDLQIIIVVAKQIGSDAHFLISVINKAWLSAATAATGVAMPSGRPPSSPTKTLNKVTDKKPQSTPQNKTPKRFREKQGCHNPRLKASTKRPSIFYSGLVKVVSDYDLSDGEMEVR